MAAPPSKTIKNLSGKWVMNKTLSDDVDPILKMQGVGWFLRNAIRLSTVTLDVSQYEEDAESSSGPSTADPTPTPTASAPTPQEQIPVTGSTPSTTAAKVTHIDINQTLSGGVSGTTEKRTLDWTFRSHTDRIFGECRGRSRWASIEDLKDEDGWLRQGWLNEDGGVRVQAFVESVGGGWTAMQVWGFEELQGKRYYARHVVVRNKEDWKQARLVYDWQEPAALDDEEWEEIPSAGI
ncbi:hypothetical protein MMC14_010127 [Varicellaria rhodocarpa]|nr:hypothetical protein [Varicellaria rhodocarpa]